MRRFLLTLLAAALVAGTLASGAAAKEGGVELTSAPYGMSAGDPWTPQLLLIDGSPEMLAQAKPRVTIRNDKGYTEDFAAKPTSEPGVYDVTVVFPEKGFWTYEAHDGITGRAYEFPVVYVDGPAVAAPTAGTPTAGTDGLPVWPFVGGGIAFALLVAAAVVALRHRRPGIERA